MWQNSDWLSFLVTVVAPTVGFSGYFLITAHILIDVDPGTKRPWFLAAVTFSLGCYFFVELCVNLAAPPGQPLPRFWNTLWWLAGLFPSIFWYRFITLIVKERFEDKPFWLKFRNTLWAIYLVAAVIFTVIGCWNVNLYRNDLLQAGPYYYVFAVYLLSNLIISGIVLIQGRNRQSQTVWQGNNLKSFFKGNLIVLFAAFWTIIWVYADSSGIKWLNSLLHTAFASQVIYQAPVELALLGVMIFLILGIQRNNQIAVRRILKESWLQILALALFMDAVIVLILANISWKAEYLPVLIAVLILGMITNAVLEIIYNRTFSNHFHDVAQFPFDSTEIVGLFKIDETALNRKIQSIIEYLAQQLKVETVELVSTNQQLQTSIRYVNPNFPASKTSAITTKNEKDFLHIDIGQSKHQPSLGKLILGPKYFRQSFTQEEMEIATFGANQIANLCAIRSTVITYNNFVRREINRRDEALSNEISFLHDTVINNLDSISKNLELCVETYEASNNWKAAHETIEYLVNCLVSLQLTVRAALKSEALKRKVPVTLVQNGLVKAIEFDYFQKYRDDFRILNIDTSGIEDEPLNSLVSPQALKILYLALEEVTNNAKRHGPEKDSKRKVSLDVELAILSEQKRLQIKVKDDGVGYNPTSLEGHFGLAEQRWHLADVGGKLEVTRLEAGGTLATIEISFSNEVNLNDNNELVKPVQL